jgi:hypothetical protein
LAVRVLHKFAQSPGRDVLGAFTVKLFCEKMGPSLGGNPPTVAPEGDLVFREKAKSTLIKVKFTFVQPMRVSDVCKKLGNPF